MRKKRFCSVFIIVSLIFWANSRAKVGGHGMMLQERASQGALWPDGQGRIFSSLEEVVSPSSPLPHLLIFFSLACHVCWDELFEMKEFIEKYNIPVGIVGIAKETPQALQSFAARYSFVYPIVLDAERQLYRKFRVRLEPYRVILERGKIIYQDDLDEDFLIRRDKAKRCLLEIASR